MATTETSSTSETPQPQVITADLTELTKVIAATVVQSLAPLLTHIQQGSSQQDMTQFGDVIGRAVQAGITATERKKVTFGQYIAKGGTSPFHPNSAKYPDGASHPKLTHQCYQNGSLLFVDTLHDEEVELLNRITHSGRYCERLVEVIVSNEGQVDEMVDIRFNNKTPDDRFNVQGAVSFNRKKHKSVFQAMLESIVTDQDEERAEVEAENEKKMVAKRPGQGHMGGSKAFQEAKARAEAKEMKSRPLTGGIGDAGEFDNV